MTDRYQFRLNPKSWGKIASPWFAYKQVDETDAKECSVCWDQCTSYLHCANSEEHIVCKLCSKEMIENTAFVNPDASIDIKWKCPLCRHDNEIGTWQFLPSTEQIKDKEASDERILQQAQGSRASSGNFVALVALAQDQGIQARQQLARQTASLTAAAPAQARREIIEYRLSPAQARREIIENRLSRIGENAPSKFRWVLSLDWRNSIVNHFKAWIMYTSPNYVENINNSHPAGAELIALKEEHHYEERKRSPQAPWFNFLERTTPP